MIDSISRRASRLEIGTPECGSMTIEATRRDHYEVHISTGAVSHLDNTTAPLVDGLQSRSIYVVTDDTVAGLYLDRVLTTLGNVKAEKKVIVIPAGETSKSADMLVHLWQRLHDRGASRRSLLIALGGGVICDLVAFAAATYMRGMPYVNVPTTLMAQVDAALGGKAGVDFSGVKNLVGAFHHPMAIVIDPLLLTTLPVDHLRNGLAEVVKVALIDDPDLFHLLSVAGADLLNARHPDLPGIVQRAAYSKMKLLASDPFEIGSLDRLLNLGHCIGHSLEAASGYSILHGYAVASGIALAATIAYERRMTTSASHLTILRTLRAFGLPVEVPPSLRQPTWKGLERISRIRNGELRLVLPLAPGRCTVTSSVDLSELAHAADLIDRFVLDGLLE